MLYLAAAMQMTVAVYNSQDIQEIEQPVKSIAVSKKSATDTE